MESKVIKTQEELDALRKEENGMYYISLGGNVATFNGKYSMNILQAMDRLSQIAIGQSEFIADCMTTHNTKEANDAIEVSLQTYLIPYRQH